MKIEETVSKYSSGELDKRTFIDEMYAIHQTLFDYASYLNRTDISNISISDNNVVMEFRNSGIKFKCTQSDKRLAPFDALNFGSYELDEIKMQLALIGERDVIFDIGGNYGWYAIHIAKERPAANILSFEPIPNTFQHLRENIALNEVSNVSLYNIGFSDKDGEFEFYFDPTLSVNASLQNLGGGNNVEVVKCKVKALDNFVAENKIHKMDFIKCDVEGAELFVFQGGISVIQHFKPVIFSEMLRKWSAAFNYHPNEIIRLLASAGYRCFIIESADSLRSIEEVTDETTATNFIFLHVDAHQDKINKYSH